MSRVAGARRRDTVAYRAPLSHARNLELADLTAFRRAVDAIEPGASGTTIAALLDNKAKRTTVLQWYAGRWCAPPWALHILADKIHAQAIPQIELARELRQIKTRPGKQAGTRNLMAYLARR